ncbi:hypothetical protein BGX33_001390, partial [Mortierella sp. NVP41]
MDDEAPVIGFDDQEALTHEPTGSIVDEDYIADQPSSALTQVVPKTILIQNLPEDQEQAALA